MIEPKLRSRNFRIEIEKMVADLGIGYMDAVVLWCDRNGVEVEQAGDWVRKDQVLRSRVQIEAEELHFMKRSSRLPI